MQSRKSETRRRERKKSRSVDLSLETLASVVRPFISGDEKNGLSQDLSKWKILDIKWEEKVFSMIRPRRKYHSISQDQNNLYLFGGEHKTTKFADLYQLDISNQAWFLMEKTKVKPPALSKHSSSIRCNNLYIFGGQKENKEFNLSMYCYNLG